MCYSVTIKGEFEYFILDNIILNKVINQFKCIVDRQSQKSGKHENINSLELLTVRGNVFDIEAEA